MFRLNQKQLTNYAKVLINYALNGGKGINPNETVLITCNECAKDLLLETHKQITISGGNVILQYLPDEFDRKNVNRTVLELGNGEQIAFCPSDYFEGMVKAIDHHVLILSTPDVNFLSGIDSKKAQALQSAYSPFYMMRTRKESEGKLSWTLCVYPTPSMAGAVGMTIEEYWEQVIFACYLDEDDPIARWRQIQAEQKEFKEKLDALKIDSVHVGGKGINLTIPIGPDRQWEAGTGQNIPSFEIFTSPDWRGVEGNIRFNQSFNYLGKTISGHWLEFKNGKVVKAGAEENEDAFLAMIAEENADKVGEFSLTDSRHSRITRSLGHILFDENIGGEFGNTHIALGNAYRDTWNGNIKEGLPDDIWHNKLGFNNCPKVHTDLISTEDRIVTAYFGENCKVIYKNGKFTLD